MFVSSYFNFFVDVSFQNVNIGAEMYERKQSIVSRYANRLYGLELLLQSRYLHLKYLHLSNGLVPFVTQLTDVFCALSVLGLQPLYRTLSLLPLSISIFEKVQTFAVSNCPMFLFLVLGYRQERLDTIFRLIILAFGKENLPAPAAYSHLGDHTKGRYQGPQYQSVEQSQEHRRFQKYLGLR